MGETGIGKKGWNEFGLWQGWGFSRGGKTWGKTERGYLDGRELTRKSEEKGRDR